MYKIGMGVIRKIVGGALNGEIANIHEDVDGETLVTVNYTDGSVKVYMEHVLNSSRYIVTEEVIW